MASEDLQAFLASMSAGGSRAALESYDLDALGRLDDPEQDEAVAACVTKIASGQNDPRAVAVLDHLFRFESEATLRETMERIPGNETKAAILKFLLEVRNRPADFRALVEVSQKGTRGGRIDALANLAGYEDRDDEVVDALVAATNDSDEDVRFQAMLHGFERLSLKQAEKTPPTTHSSIGRLLLSPVGAVRAEGARMFAEAAADSREGREPDMRGFPETVRQPLEAFFTTMDALDAPLAPLDAFEDRPRAWIEEVLLARAHTDERMTRALAGFDTGRSLATLEELAASDWGTAAAAAEALGTLRRARLDAALTALSAARGLTTEVADAHARTIASQEPECLFEAAAILSAADDDVRRAFADGALAAVPEWAKANRADLETALGLSEPAGL